ncbi:ABC transporter permease, partial [Loktanella sp. DJP18]
MNPVLGLAFAALIVLVVAQILASFFAPAVTLQSNADGTLIARGGILGTPGKAVNVTFAVTLLVAVCYLFAGIVMSWPGAGIFGGIARRFLPVFLALIALFVVSLRFKRRLGLYGKLFDSTVGMIGFGLVMFWVFTAVFSGVFDLIATHDPLRPISSLKNKLPGVAVPEEGLYPFYLLGG